MTLRILANPEDVRNACDEARLRGPVGFIPTMGALHEGHLSLVRAAKRQASFVVVSIFVNPTQFGPREDFARYPRDLEADAGKLALAGVDLLFAPATHDMYPPGDETRVRVGAVAADLEGAHRPGHFEGVATVVTKLFGVVGPSSAFFGRKDYQQLLVVAQVVRDLFLPVRVLGQPIVRETDGLALSSRNAYLSTHDHARALAIVRGLDAAARRFATGERETGVLAEEARRHIAPVADSVDYVEIRSASTLAPVSVVRDRAVLLVACRFGSTRLIDNVVLGEDPPPLGGLGPLGT